METKKNIGFYYISLGTPIFFIMEFSAFIHSEKDEHRVTVNSKGVTKELRFESGPHGFGSSINGGELLSLAIATCFCNDLYREASNKDITINEITIHASGHFNELGQPGENFTYKVSAKGDTSNEELNQLILHTDKVAEIHNTLRKGVEVTLITDN